MNVTTVPENGAADYAAILWACPGCRRINHRPPDAPIRACVTCGWYFRLRHQEETIWQRLLRWMGR